MFCVQCGAELVPNAAFCAHCGKPVAVQPRIPRVASVEPTGSRTIVVGKEATESRVALDALYTAAIGDKNTDYYLEDFASRDGGGSGKRWHWPTLFLTGLWLAYRKQWLYFSLYAVLTLLLGRVADAVDSYAILTGWLLLLFIGPPLLANQLYYRHVRARLAEAQAHSPNFEEQLTFLRRKGGTTLAPVTYLVLIVGLTAIAIPQYAEYTQRAKVSTALAAAKTATDAVSEYYRRNSTLPLSLLEAGIDRGLAGQRLLYDPQDGTIAMPMALPGNQTGTLQLSPVYFPDGSIVWICVSHSIPEKYLPGQCRQ